MSEYIERIAAIRCCIFGKTSLGLMGELRRLPAADVVPVRHAHWIKHGKPNERLPQYEVMFWSCSRCGQVERNLTPYCCNCGAKMDGGADNDLSAQ